MDGPNSLEMDIKVMNPAPMFVYKLKYTFHKWEIAKYFLCQKEKKKKQRHGLNMKMPLLNEKTILKNNQHSRGHFSVFDSSLAVFTPQKVEKLGALLVYFHSYEWRQGVSGFFRIP